MRALTCTCALLLTFVLGRSADALAASGKAAAPRARKGIDKSPARGGAPERPVKITSDTFEVLPGEKHASWKGNVVIVRDDMRIRCRALVADYDDQKRLKRLTCTGNAHMRQAARANRPSREVWGEVAVFDNETALLTVTGSPRAREGQNTMEGEKITFDSTSDKLRVERVRMVIDSPPDKDPLAVKPRPASGGGAPEPPR